MKLKLFVDVKLYNNNIADIVWRWIHDYYRFTYSKVQVLVPYTTKVPHDVFHHSPMHHVKLLHECTHDSHYVCYLHPGAYPGIHQGIENECTSEPYCCIHEEGRRTIYTYLVIMYSIDRDSVTTIFESWNMLCVHTGGKGTQPWTYALYYVRYISWRMTNKVC